MNGTTLCPHCATRFKISEAQLAAHHGIVRCGHCLQAFDARPNFVPEQPGPQLDLLTDEVTDQDEAAVFKEQDERGLSSVNEAPDTRPPDEDELSTRPTEDEAATTREDAPSDSVSSDESALPESDDPLDFSHPVVSVEVQADDFSGVPTDTLTSEERPARTLAEQVIVVHDEIEDAPPATPERHTALRVIAALVLTVLLMAQAGYFFRVGLAAHLPVLKPALVGYCQLLNCSVPLPQNTELMGIESSSLVAEPEHENQITLNALLRNRASYSTAFPTLELTLNDNQDRPLARRLFLPEEYLPADENEQTGFPKNHEINLKLRMNTADLRPEGYRLELFYPR
ncbi:MAG: DUF3426 domain-containing protein [Gallionella sp.]|nr:DUF3426 domain-containing protein [Gallionella sp.]